MPTVAPYDFDEPVIWAGILEDEPVVCLVDGRVVFPTRSNETIVVGDGALTATSAQDGKSLVVSTEDGTLVSVTAQGAVSTLLERPGQWMDTLASGPNGAVAAAAGRTVFMVADGSEREWRHERAVEGVSFAPKGLRIACARYNGVTLHWGVGDATPVELHWDGAHTGVTFSPDGKYIVTTMAENALHGWRLDDKRTGDGKHMRMTGYPAKPKSLSWSSRGKWLASSGAQAAICWPFSGKDGPMGKAPKELGTRGDSMVVEVACHPTEQVVAIGYADGMVMAVRIEDGSEALLRRGGQGPVSRLTWDHSGNRLAFGTEAGEAGLIAL